MRIKLEAYCNKDMRDSVCHVQLMADVNTTNDIGLNLDVEQYVSSQVILIKNGSLNASL